MQKVDKTEKAIRFGYGFVFGLVVVLLWVAVHFIPSSMMLLVIEGLVGGMLCGWLAMKYGDDFWYGLWEYVRGWWS